MQKTRSLPLPDDDILNHSEKVAHFIRSDLMRSGAISFARFMQAALYTPGLGYYCAGLKKFGKEGDFTTAPEISPIFSRCIAQQCYQILAKIPESAILELGAGQGTMAVEILLELERLQQLPKKYYILDLSADLVARQKMLFSNTIPHLLPRIEWLSSLDDFSMNGIILANEVLDAMPVTRFKIRQNKIYEYGVSWDNGFQWVLKEADSALTQAIQNLQIDFADEYDSEINIQLSGWLKTMSTVLQRGILLISDYGFPRHEYYHPDRYMGTLMCHYQHRAHDDPLVLTGIQDVTAHVDFTLVAEEGDKHGFTIDGYTNQAQFLMSCGITEKIHGITDISILNQIKLLLMPTEMGELFKFIALTKNWEHSLLGFELKDLREKL